MEEKVEEYIKILYTECELKNEKNKINIDRDRKFIEENIEEIDKKIEENNKNQTTHEEENQPEKQEILEEKINNLDTVFEQNNIINEENQKLINKNLLTNIIKNIKIDKYFELLHPEYKNLTEEEKYYALDDKDIIKDCFEAIDIYYQDCKEKGTGAQEMEWTDYMIIKTSLELFNKQEKIFTPNDIEQFSNKVKYSEFKQAISDIKEVVNENVEGNN